MQTYSQYHDMYEQRAIDLGLNYEHEDVTFFDAVWTYALALNKTIQGTTDFHCDLSKTLMQNYV